MINDEIMVSVSCMVYNHAKYLRKCLDGFVMQKTNFKFEVLVHDDASTDGSQDIIREYEEKYPDIIKPIYQKENQYSKHIGITKTFQIPRMKGKYVAICEGDDYWIDENKLQQQYDIMEANPNVSVCVHKVFNVNESGEVLNTFFPSFDIEKNLITSSEYLNLIKEHDLMIFQTTALFFRKDLYVRRFKEQITFLQISDVGDYPMMLFAVQNGDVYYFDKVMSCYRVSSNGSWTERVLHNTEKRKHHIKNIIEVIKSYNEYTDNKFEDILNEIIKEKEFLYCLVNEEYKKCLSKENRKYLKKYKFNFKEKLNLYINALFPGLIKATKKMLFGAKKDE